MEAEVPQDGSSAAGVSSKGANEGSPSTPKPICCIVIGMAGCGKTTLMQRINNYMNQKNLRSYLLNLDPAVSKVPFGANIDIRDTVNYKEVMKQYELGPNGAILTSLNLFATRFDQVMDFVEKRKHETDYIFADTPGQIEVFAWSASGQIITDSLASSIPTVILYVVDTPRTSSPVTFMSNMLHAIDVHNHEVAKEWMTDYDTFAAALEEEKGYIGDFSRSLGLVLEEFYEGLKCVGVSAVSGAGMDELFEAIDYKGIEYIEVYATELQRRRQKKSEDEQAKQMESLAKLKEDLQKTGGQTVILDAKTAAESDDVTETADQTEYSEFIKFLGSSDNKA